MAKCINVKYDGKPLYDIVIEKSFSRLSDEFNRLGVTGRKLCIVSDSNVARLYADDVAKELEKIRTIEHTVELMTIPYDEVIGVLSGEEILNLDWMLDD